MGARKNHAKLLQIWLSGKYQSLPQMAKGLAGTEDAVSLTQLKSISAAKGFIRKRAENMPKLEAMIQAKSLAKDSTRIARIRSGLIELEELLLEKIKAPLKNKKAKFSIDEALKGIRSLAEMHARVVDPRMGRQQEHEAPTGESPLAGTMAGASANVTVNIHGAGAALAEDDLTNPLKVTDADLEDAVRAGKAIIYDERPAKPKALKPAAKKGNKA